MFDPLTAFATASVFALLSGSVFGFIYSALPGDVRKSARDWQVGTLMMAVCLACFATLRTMESDWLRWSGNTLWFVATAFYWRSMRRYFNLPENHMVFFAAGAGAFASILFMVVLPNFSIRVAIATVCGSIALIGAAFTLIQHRNIHPSKSGWVLAVLFIASMLLLVVRSLYFFKFQVRDGVMVESKQWVVPIVPILISALPIVGTTAFALMCLERPRHESLHGRANVA